MASKLVDRINHPERYGLHDISVQTNEECDKIHKGVQTGDPNELYVQLDKTKSMHMYYSQPYKDYVICLNFSNCKRYIITRSVWHNFKQHFDHINNAFDS